MDDIKMAYRRLARKYHPDINQDDPTAADKFRRVQEAYQVLKEVDAGIRPKQDVAPPATTKVQRPPTPTPSPAPQKPPQKAPQPSTDRFNKIKIDVRDVRTSQDPLSTDPELKLKLDMLRRVQELLKQKKYVVAIAVVEGMRERYPKSPEVLHWQAVTYYRWGSELIIAGKLREAEIYLNKALNTDPKNRELCFEVKRDLERLKQKPLG
ncbi:J domain-containing protein [Tumidithrix elongata]